MRLRITLIFLFLLPLIVFSQSISGRVIDAVTNEPLPYANMVLLSKNKGVTTNEEGMYTFNISGETNDILLISYLGYASQKIPLKQFQDKVNSSLNIELIENRSLIDEVVLDVKKAKYTSRKKIGVEKHFFKFSSSGQFGFERCVLMKNPSFREGKVDELTIFLKKREDELYEVLPTYFRIKFYEYDVRNKRPGKLLSYEQIILKPENKTQKINIDLKEYYVKYPREGICVGIETFNPGEKRTSKTIYITSPCLKFTYSDEPLTWSSYKGKDWFKNKMMLGSKVFGRKKDNYYNPLIQMKVQFRK